MNNSAPHSRSFNKFDDKYIGGSTVGKKRGRGTEKSKVFVAVSIDKKGRPK